MKRYDAQWLVDDKFPRKSFVFSEDHNAVVDSMKKRIAELEARVAVFEDGLSEPKYLIDLADQIWPEDVEYNDTESYSDIAQWLRRIAASREGER